jgi:hypothetical protein
MEYRQDIIDDQKEKFFDHKNKYSLHEEVKIDD